MQLPPQLHHAIEQTIAHQSNQSLTKAATELSQSYRDPQSQSGAFMATETHRLAYLATRMPATYSANCAVFAEIQRLLSDKKITSLLDIGAGPGTASWAATQTVPTLQTVTLIERDTDLIKIGNLLADRAENALLKNANWLQKDLTQATSFPVHDLVICSYALNELNVSIARQVLQAAWTATRIALIVVEPGTMLGFGLVRQLREDLISLGGHVIAPCPHQNACPLPTDDWCHFSQRVNRSALHRHLKVGHLGYEDEKFSYIIASKEPIPSPQSRVIRHPIRRSGNTQLQLCTQEGLQSLTITRSDKPNWKRVRKTNWGDIWS
jgi:ribosomal protein RSM22 (predicted rRNA methylase)